MTHFPQLRVGIRELFRSLLRMGRRARNMVVVSPRAFAWDRALVATLRHSTLRSTRSSMSKR